MRLDLEDFYVEPGEMLATEAVDLAGTTIPDGFLNFRVTTWGIPSIDKEEAAKLVEFITNWLREESDA